MNTTDQCHEVRHDKYNKDKTLCWNVDCSVDGTECTGHHEEWNQDLNRKHQVQHTQCVKKSVSLYIRS